MLATILVLLIVLWFLGFIHIPGLVLRNINLFTFSGHTITLWELLIFIVIVWAIEALPSPLRQIAFILVILWLLSIFGIIAIAGLSNLIVVAIIIGLVFAVLQH